MTYVLFVHDRPDALTGLPVDERRAIFAEYEALQALPGLAGHRLKPASGSASDQIRSSCSRARLPPPLERATLPRELAVVGRFVGGQLVVAHCHPRSSAGLLASHSENSAT